MRMMLIASLLVAGVSFMATGSASAATTEQGAGYSEWNGASTTDMSARRCWVRTVCRGYGPYRRCRSERVCRW